MQDAGNDGPIVDARLSRPAARQLRLQRLMLDHVIPAADEGDGFKVFDALAALE
jgi:hypothetical protein